LARIASSCSYNLDLVTDICYMMSSPPYVHISKSSSIGTLMGLAVLSPLCFGYVTSHAAVDSEAAIVPLDDVENGRVQRIMRQRRKQKTSALLTADGRVLEERSSTCVPMQLLDGSRFVVQLEAGTPGQNFSVIPDTGSDNIIIPSCVCQQHGACDSQNHCFTGTNHSSTFHMEQHPTSLQMTFGSGSIEADVATDMVNVGGVTANMSCSLLLMVNQQLDFTGAGDGFEGLLGLGPPSQKTAMLASRRMRITRRNDACGSSPDSIGTFLQHSGVTEFTMCADASSGKGALVLGDSVGSTKLASVGEYHWGLSFTGLTVGAAENSTWTAPIICGPNSPNRGEQSPCGVIPDSGTTMLSGPKVHIEKIFAGICDEWERCRNAVHGSSTKVKIFEELLANCSQWASDSSFSELPDINLRLAGKEGTEQIITLSGVDYILETNDSSLADFMQHRHENATSSSGPHKFCMPAFDSTEYNTKQNGPVWILGLPLFMSYKVGYDLQSNAITFDRGSCTECGSWFGFKKPDKHHKSHGNLRQTHKRPRHYRGPARRPGLDRDFLL